MGEKAAGGAAVQASSGALGRGARRWQDRDQSRSITQGAIVEKKRLDAALQWIAQQQQQRDVGRLANRKFTFEDEEADSRGGRSSGLARPVQQDISTWEKTGHFYFATTFEKQRSNFLRALSQSNEHTPQFSPG
jgi:hypothetical protein